MDSAYLQRIRFQLQKRFRRLNSCGHQMFHSALVQFWAFLHDQSLVSGILAKLDAEAKPYETEIAALSRNSVEIFGTEAEQNAFCYRVIQHCAALPLGIQRPPEIWIGRALNGSAKHDEALNAFRETFLEPFYEYIDEALDQQEAVLSLLVKYKRSVEWFTKDEVVAVAQSDERKLARHLYAYLFDQGLDFHIEPQSASGEADLVSPELVLDAKVFDGDRRGLAYLANGVHQVHTYARDFNQQVGYLVVFKTCGDTIDFTFGAPGQLAPFVKAGGKTIYIFVVDICQHNASASKRGPMKVHAVDQALLVRDVKRTSDAVASEEEAGAGQGD
jgi:hypothetical protein